MAVRYISKGKGKNRKSFPIKPKRGVSVRSVSLQPSSIAKVNKEQIKLLNRGVPATFSKALNQVVLRAKRNGIPTYDTHVNTNNRRKPYIMHVTDMKKHKKVKGSDTVVMADSYGQAVDDFIIVWNKDPNRMQNQIGYPVVQGTAMKDFRYKKDKKSFVLGYSSRDDKIKHFKNTTDAFNNSDEFVTIEANNLDEAKKVYWTKQWEWEDKRS
ncbi:MAG: hypothetical protein KJI69_03765 [Patescibacteria group bacterium]|nr:hypothetical protein [Patescibacteria group bacterium]